MADNQETIVEGLREQLTEFHFQWLCACAVYPGLRWPLTVWHGVRLAERAGRPLPDEDEHLPLIRLPWFRQGFIPNEMRLRLLQELSQENRDAVRSDIEALFAAARPVDDGERTHFVLNLKRPGSSFWSRLKHWWRKDKNESQDVIFVRYMMGGTPSELDLELDRRLAQMLGAQLAGWVNWRALLAAAATASIATGAWAVGTYLEKNWQIDVVDRTVALPQMVYIPGGTFTMGSPANEANRSDDEGPQRQVMIKPFAIGKYEVTFKEWDDCVDGGGCRQHSKDGGLGRGRLPVIYVSKSDTKHYVEWLSRKTGNEYRLPTEAEWEYAARAGTTTPFSTGSTITTDQANFEDKSSIKGSLKGRDFSGTVPVGSFEPNLFGLHDMHGNVWEWVEDCWTSNYQGAPSDGSANTTNVCSEFVGRGGSFVNAPKWLRSASRTRVFGSDKILTNAIGFRVTRTLVTP